MRRLFILPVVVLPVVVLLTAGCTGSSAARVQTDEVVRATVTEVVNAPGRITAKATSTVTAPADGTVAALLVPDGVTVTKGTILLRLDSPAAQQRLAQARSAKAAAATRPRVPQADLSPLQDQLDAAADGAFAAARAAAAQVPDPTARQGVLDAVAAAEARYRGAATAARSIAGSVSAGASGLGSALDALGSSQRLQADALLQAAQTTVEALTVTAPQDGVVTYGAGGGAAPAAPGGLSGLLGQLPAGLAGALPSTGSPPATSAALAVGGPVASGGPMLTVTDVSGLGVTADVDETDILLVRPGVLAGVQLDAVPGAAYDAAVASVDVTPSPAAGGGVTYRVRLTLTPGSTADGTPSPQPRPGMSAVVDLRVREAVNAVSVPSSAVLRDGAKAAVFIQDGTGGGAVLRRREVVLGAQGSDRVEVVSGLEVGQRIVSRDADRLRDGQQA